MPADENVQTVNFNRRRESFDSVRSAIQSAPTKRRRSISATSFGRRGTASVGRHRCFIHVMAGVLRTGIAAELWCRLKARRFSGSLCVVSE